VEKVGMGQRTAMFPCQLPFCPRVSIRGESRDGAKNCHVPLPTTILSLFCTQLASRVGTADPFGNTV